MIFIPVVELLESGETQDLVDLSETFKILIQAAKDSPSVKDKSEVRLSLSAVKASWGLR